MNTPPPHFDFVREHYALAPHTFYRIGGPARWAFFPKNQYEVEAAYCWINAQHMPVLVLGAGSNMLIDDRGFPGAVVFTTELKKIEHYAPHEFLIGTGIPLADIVCSLMLPNNYAGVGALTGIPGTLGGALFMNAGTVNGAICEFTKQVSLLTPSGITELDIRPEFYGYRSQSFCKKDRIIISAKLAFEVSEKDETAIYRHYIQRRRETQPQGWCCGSVFKNPPDNHAGRLIESCGLKGTRVGGAIISEKHANFIMNEDNATFQDVMGLMQLVKETVHTRFGIVLEEEVRIISAESAPTMLPG